MKQFSILQGVTPHYRIKVFDALDEQLKAQKMSLTVYSGAYNDYGMFRDAAQGKSWRTLVENTYLPKKKKKLLWQHLPFLKVLFSGQVVIQNNPRILSDWLVLVFRKLLRRPVITWGQLWSRSGRSYSLNNFLRFCNWFATDARVVYTEAEAFDMHFHGLTAVPARNAIYTKNAQPPSEAEGDGTVSFVIVSRLNKVKKVDIAIEAVDILAQKGIFVRLEIIGDGDELTALRDMVSRLKLDDRVALHGFMDLHDPEMRMIMGRSLAALSPGFVGLSALQAFFHGVVFLVAKDEPHAPEIEACQEGFNTFFFESNNPNALAELMKWVCNNKKMLVSRRKTIFTDVLGKYTVETMAHAFIQAFENATLRKASII